MVLQTCEKQMTAWLSGVSQWSQKLCSPEQVYIPHSEVMWLLRNGQKYCFFQLTSFPIVLKWLVYFKKPFWMQLLKTQNLYALLLAWRQCEKVSLRILTVLWKRNIWELLPLGTGTRHQVLLNPAAQLHWRTAFSQMPPPFLWKETGNRALSHLQTQPDSPHMFTMPWPGCCQMAMHNCKGAMGVQAVSSMATCPENSWGNLRVCTKWESGQRVNS